MTAATTCLLAVAIMVIATAGAACGDDDPDVEPTVAATHTLAPGAVRTPVTDEGWIRVDGMRGLRYCEVLILRVVEARLNGEVWNTIGLNDCPQTEWDALDLDAIKVEHEGITALRNGPRYWLSESIERQPPPQPARRTTFGGLEMQLGAMVDIGPIPPNLAPYTERHVERETAFEFAQGSQVYEIVTGDGRTFVMQSYSQQADPALTEDGLAGIGDRLALPAEWAFRARTLEAPLRVATHGDGATVFQDDLSNTYQLFEE